MNSAIVLLTLWLGVAPVEKGEVTFRPGPRESSVPERFRMAAAVFSYELEPVMATPHYTVSKLRFPSLIETTDPENNVVHAEYFAPVGFGPRSARGDRAPHPGGRFPAFAVHGRATG